MLVVVVLALAAGIHLVGAIFSWCVIRLPALQARRLQPPRAQDVPAFRARLRLVGGNLALLAALVAALAHFAGGLFDLRWPGVAAFAAQFAVILVADEVFFYGYHRLLHTSSWAYRNIHRVHHRARAPFPLDYLHVHPVELILGGTGMVLGLVAVVAVAGQISAWAFFGYMVWRDTRELVLHSGLPSLSGITEGHDAHHARMRGNYASNLSLLDRVFGTVLER